MADELSLHDATEGTSFLGSDEQQEPEQRGRQSAKADVPSSRWTISRYQVSSPNAVVGLVSLIIFCMALSGTMSLIPLGRLIEDAICRRYYGSSDPVDEKLCKVDEVQTELAWLGGLYVVIDSTIGTSSHNLLPKFPADACYRLHCVIPLGYHLGQVILSHTPLTPTPESWSDSQTDLAASPSFDWRSWV